MKYTAFFISMMIFLFPVSEDHAFARLSTHPIELYEKGESLISTFTGDIDTLMMAQDVFIVLIEKYPNSPFGYLGMSHIYRIDAHLGEGNYDLTLIQEWALPFALKALQLGPSIKAVHENYAFFERFLADDGNAVKK